MKVTPLNRRFGKYLPGDTFDIHPAAAKVFITKGRLAAAQEAPVYQTRMMTAAVGKPSDHIAAPAEVEAMSPIAAPYGYKADGTPRQRPGRPAKAE